MLVAVRPMALLAAGDASNRGASLFQQPALPLQGDGDQWTPWNHSEGHDDRQPDRNATWLVAGDPADAPIGGEVPDLQRGAHRISSDFRAAQRGASLMVDARDCVGVVDKRLRRVATRPARALDDGADLRRLVLPVFVPSRIAAGLNREAEAHGDCGRDEHGDTNPRGDAGRRQLDGARNRAPQLERYLRDGRLVVGHRVTSVSLSSA